MHIAAPFDHTVIDALPLHMIVLAQDGTIIAANQAWSEFARVNGGTMTGTGVGVNYLEVCRRVDGKDAPVAQAALNGIQAVLDRTETDFTLEYACHSIDTKRWYLMQVTPYAIGGGVVVFHLDITKRKGVQEALAQEHNLLRTLMDSLPDHIFVKDVAGRYVLVNQSYAHFLGIASPEAVVGKSVFDVYPYDLAEKYYANDLAVLQGGQILSNDEVATAHYTGALQFHMVTKTPLRNEAGALIGLVGIGHDITEHHHMLEALRQSEARNRALLEAIPDAILRINSDGAYVDVKAPTNFKPIKPIAELTGKKQMEVLPPVVAQRVTHYSQEARATGQMQLFEYDIEIDGETYTRESRVVPVNNDEVIVIVRDISERKRAENEKARLLAEVVQQREQLRALSRRLAEIQETERKSIARELHDQVGQNLTALGFALKLIQIQIPTEADFESQLKEQLQGALVLVAQSTGAIRNLMTELRPAVLDDYGLLAALRWYGAQIASYSDLTIEVYGEAKQPRLPETIENALFRIAQEAMTNIVKHAKTTQARIHLTTTDERVTLEITDNGQGFDVEALMATTTQSHWGLLNMRERAEAIGGQFEIVSHPDTGVSVIVEVMR